MVPDEEVACTNTRHKEKPEASCPCERVIGVCVIQSLRQRCMGAQQPLTAPVRREYAQATHGAQVEDRGPWPLPAVHANVSVGAAWRGSDRLQGLGFLEV